MARAAYDMSAVTHEHAAAHLLSVEGGAEPGGSSLPQLQTHEDTDSDDDADVIETDREKEEQVLLAKTTIKRPIKLAKLKEKTRYFRNHFGQCAEAFFFPVMRALLQALDKLHEELVRGGVAAGLFATELAATTVDPGLSVLLPAQALLTLGAFVKSAVNTLCQQ